MITDFLYDLTDVLTDISIISLKTLNLKVNGLNPYNNVEIRLYKLNDDVSELLFWKNNALLAAQFANNSLLRGLHF